MPIFSVPTPRADEPSRVQVTDLSGVDFELTFDWNGRLATWFLDVATSAGDLVAGGLALVPGSRLLRRRVGVPGRPAGALVVVGDPGGAPPGLDSFERGDAALLYVDGDDLASLGSLP